LDNGLIEGDPRPIEELVLKAEMINADEIVLPDVFRDRKGTYNAVVDALATMRRLGMPFRTMAVAQGDTLDEWISSAKDLLQLPISTLGIPKVVAKLIWDDPTNADLLWNTDEDGFWLNRLKVLQFLQNEIEAAGVQIHLLGCWDTPLEIKAIAAAVEAETCPEVRGTDSAIAYAHARIGQKMSEGDRPTGAIDFGATDLEPDDLTLKYNIQMWQAECRVSKDLIPRFW